jgi:hypothetical protein
MLLKILPFALYTSPLSVQALQWWDNYYQGKWKKHREELPALPPFLPLISNGINMKENEFPLSPEAELFNS